jgi:hypothetical protein
LTRAAHATTTTPDRPSAPASGARRRAGSAAVFACAGRGARSGRLPRRKILANHCASLARVVSTIGHVAKGKEICPSGAGQK